MTTNERAPSPSARVRLEAEVLTTQLTADHELPVSRAADADVSVLRTVLVVASDADLRRYVRECLRDVQRVRVIEAASVTEALDLAVHDSPHVLIADWSAASVVSALSEVRAVLIADDLAEISDARQAPVSLLPEPFSAERLAGEVARMIT